MESARECLTDDADDDDEAAADEDVDDVERLLGNRWCRRMATLNPAKLKQNCSYIVHITTVLCKMACIQCNCVMGIKFKINENDSPNISDSKIQRSHGVVLVTLRVPHSDVIAQQAWWDRQLQNTWFCSADDNFIFYTLLRLYSISFSTTKLTHPKITVNNGQILYSTENGR